MICPNCGENRITQKSAHRIHTRRGPVTRRRYLCEHCFAVINAYYPQDGHPDRGKPPTVAIQPPLSIPKDQP